MASVGFDAVLRGSPVASLSGGWKMKLALGALHALAWHSVVLRTPLSCVDVAWQHDAKHVSRARTVGERAKASTEDVLRWGSLCL